MSQFQFLGVNPDGTLKIEYYTQNVADIPFPVDATGHRLLGEDLKRAVDEYVSKHLAQGVDHPRQFMLHSILGIPELDVPVNQQPVVYDVDAA